MSMGIFAPAYFSYSTEELEPTFRVRRVDFGDGYHQDSGDGLNTVVRRWNFHFVGSEELVKAYRDFLLAMRGRTPIWFQPYGEPAPLPLICTKLPTPFRPVDLDKAEIVAIFEQSFAAAGPMPSDFMFEILRLSGLNSNQLMLGADFTVDRYWQDGAVYSGMLTVPGLSFSRSGTRFTYNAQGGLHVFGSGVPRRISRGLKIDPAVINYGTFPSIGSGWAAAATGWTFSSSFNSPDGTPGRKAVRVLDAPSVSRQISIAVPVVANDQVTMDIYLSGEEGIDYASFGLIDGSATWGALADSSAEIISGPGTLVILGSNGGIREITGLSQVQRTRVRLTRRAVSTTTFSAYWYPGSRTIGPAGAGTLGAQVMVTLTPGIVDPVPNTAPSSSASVGADTVLINDRPHRWPVTWFAEVELGPGMASQAIANYTAIAAGNSARLMLSSINQAYAATFAGGAVQSQPFLAGTVEAGILRFASRHSGRTSIIATGRAPVTGAEGIDPTSLALIALGTLGGSNYMDGYLRKIALFSGVPADGPFAQMVAM